MNSYEIFKNLRTIMLNSPSNTLLELCHPLTICWKDGKAEEKTTRKNLKVKRKLLKIDTTLYIGKGLVLKPVLKPLSFR